MTSRSWGEAGSRTAAGSASTMREDLGVGDEAALDHLAEAGDQLGLGQRAEQVEVAEHPGGLVEGADEVLAGAGVDAGLAADRRVDHAEQRRRHVDHPHAAQPGRGDEAADVGGRAAADGDDRVGAGEAGPSQLLPRVGRHLRRLGGLAVGERDRQQLDVAEAGHHLVGERGQRLGVTDRHPADVGAEGDAHVVEDRVADDDVVGRGSADVHPRLVLTHGRHPPRPRHARARPPRPPRARRCRPRRWPPTRRPGCARRSTA